MFLEETKGNLKFLSKNTNSITEDIENKIYSNICTVSEQLTTVIKNSFSEYINKMFSFNEINFTIKANQEANNKKFEQMNPNTKDKLEILNPSIVVSSSRKSSRQTYSKLESKNKKESYCQVNNIFPDNINNHISTISVGHRMKKDSRDISPFLDSKLRDSILLKVDDKEKTEQQKHEESRKSSYRYSIDNKDPIKLEKENQNLIRKETKDSAISTLNKGNKESSVKDIFKDNKEIKSIIKKEKKYSKENKENNENNEIKESKDINKNKHNNKENREINDNKLIYETNEDDEIKMIFKVKNHKNHNKYNNSSRKILEEVNINNIDNINNNINDINSNNNINKTPDINKVPDLHNYSNKNKTSEISPDINNNPNFNNKPNTHNQIITKSNNENNNQTITKSNNENNNPNQIITKSNKTESIYSTSNIELYYKPINPSNQNNSFK